MMNDETLIARLTVVQIGWDGNELVWGRVELGTDFVGTVVMRMCQDMLWMKTNIMNEE